MSYKVMISMVSDNVFFFQAEDGIRVADVTGVQTCALPICFAGAGLAFDQQRALKRDRCVNSHLQVIGGYVFFGTGKFHGSVSCLVSMKIICVPGGSERDPVSTPAASPAMPR